MALAISSFRSGQQVSHLLEDVTPGGSRHPGPPGETLGGRPHRQIDILGAGIGKSADHIPDVRGIPILEIASGRGADPAAGDESS